MWHSRPLVIIASHNIMHGLRLDGLVRSYRSLRDRVGLDVLCIQENLHDGEGSHASRIASTLGAEFVAIWDRQRPSTAMVFDASRFAVDSERLVRLPQPNSVSWIDRTYLKGGILEERFAQLAVLAPHDRDERVAIANFHLQTAGAGREGTEIRRRQIDEVALALEADGSERVVVCGDTNAFCWPWNHQPSVLQYILGPLLRFDAHDPGGPATHFFARQNEPWLTHRLAVLLGRLGIDLPMRFDVICTNLSVARRGHETTPDSDHDLVWAELA